MPSQKTIITSNHLPDSIPVSPCQTHTNSKTPPWRIINDISFNQSVTISLPNPLYELVWPGVQALLPTTKYAKVFLKLEHLLSGDIFDVWIKRGKLSMDLDRVMDLHRRSHGVVQIPDERERVCVLMVSCD